MSRYIKQNIIPVFDKAHCNSICKYTKLYDISYFNLDLIFEVTMESNSFRIINLPINLNENPTIQKIGRKIILVDTVLSSSNKEQSQFTSCKITIDNYGILNLIFDEKIQEETIIYVGPKLIVYQQDEMVFQL